MRFQKSESCFLVHQYNLTRRKGASASSLNGKGTLRPLKGSAQKITEITKSPKSKIRRCHLTNETICQNFVFEIFVIFCERFLPRTANGASSLCGTQRPEPEAKKALAARTLHSGSGAYSWQRPTSES